MTRWLQLWNAFWFPRTTSLSLAGARIVAVAAELFWLLPSLDYHVNLATKNTHFTDATATCMLVGEDAYFMLLTPDKFASFSKRPAHDPHTTTAAFFALSVDSREAVDEMMRKAIASGGAPAEDPQDHGFMYGQAFYDLDGHVWEVFWMDPKAIPSEG